MTMTNVEIVNELFNQLFPTEYNTMLENDKTDLICAHHNISFAEWLNCLLADFCSDFNDEYDDCTLTVRQLKSMLTEKNLTDLEIEFNDLYEIISEDFEDEDDDDYEDEDYDS